MSAALAQVDFGPVFLRVRAATGCSQRRLGELFDMDQSTLSKIELGKRALTTIATVIRVMNALVIPASKLGFRHWDTVGVTGQEGSWMDKRRGFLDKVSGLAFGATAVDLSWLLSLFPPMEPTGTRRVGAADVEAIEQATATYVRQDHATGSGPVRDGAVFHLRTVLPLLNGQVSDEVRPRLRIAIARLAMQAGWMSFDVLQHEAARRLWMMALGLARDSGHPLESDLTVYLLFDMAIQAVQVGRPDEALKLVHFGHAAGAGQHVSAPTTSVLSSIMARAHAAQGDARACERALHQAQEYFASIDPQNRPPWGAHFDEIGLAAWQASTHYAFARAERDPLAASRAVALLYPGVNHLGPDRASARALYLPKLAGAHALAGDVDTAVSVGHQAIDAVTSVHSPRAYGGLRVLHTVLEPMHTSPGVTELRERLSATAT